MIGETRGRGRKGARLVLPAGRLPHGLARVDADDDIVATVVDACR